MHESVVLLNDAETVLKLACCVFEGASPEDLDLTLRSVMELHARLRANAARVSCSVLYGSDGRQYPAPSGEE